MSVRKRRNPALKGNFKVQTSGANPFAAQTLVFPSDGTYAVSIVVGAREGDINRGMYKRSALFYRNSGGPAIMQDAVVDELTIEAVPAWDVTMVVSGNNAEIRVTGSANAIVDWNIEFSISALT